jgi:hypothetical protein
MRERGFIGAMTFASISDTLRVTSSIERHVYGSLARLGKELDLGGRQASIDARVALGQYPFAS